MNLSEKRRIISKAWKDFFILGIEDIDGVGELVKESWIRSKSYGVNVYRETNLDSDNEEQKKSIDRLRGFIDIARPYMYDLFKIIKDSGFMITLTDSEGFILDTLITSNIDGNTNIRTVNLSEKRVGTNAMGTCLYLDRPVQTWAEENCYRGFHEFTTSASPIHDMEGGIIGCIGITGYADVYPLHTLGMATAIAYAIENKLRLSDKDDSSLFIENYAHIIKQSVSDGIIVVDKTGKVTSINKTAEGLLNMEEALAVQRSIYDIIRGPDSLKRSMKENRDFYDREYVLTLSNKNVKCKISVTNLNNHREIIGQIIVMKRIAQEKRYSINTNEKNRMFSFEDIIGNSEAMKEAVKLGKIAAKGNSNVLILGESGTGKELFAQSIHNDSQRRDRPFVAVNCGALPLNLAESELFGYEGGAFTSSKKEGQPGKFEMADGGTIFLDEIGEMPMSIQASLLRVIQDRRVVRVGSSVSKNVDVMIIAATNKDLFEGVRKGTFRADLFYRLNVFTINIPPLRERREDIAELLKYFINKYNKRFHTTIEGVSEQVLDIFLSYDWFGNVRELENIIERALQICQDNVMSVKDLPMYLQLAAGDKHTIRTSKISYMESKEWETITAVLEKTGGNAKESSGMLGIGRATLYRKLNKYGIDLNKYRK